MYSKEALDVTTHNSVAYEGLGSFFNMIIIIRALWDVTSFSVVNWFQAMLHLMKQISSYIQFKTKFTDYFTFLNCIKY
jgi:hypothetical protein